MPLPMTLTVEPTPTTPPLSLRPWWESDTAAIVAAHCDEAMRRWLMRPIYDEDEARAWIADQQTGWVDGTHLSWAIEEGGMVVGSFVIKAANPPETFATSVGYWTVAAARGKGIASRCVKTATEWLFGEQDFMPADDPHCHLEHAPESGGDPLLTIALITATTITELDWHDE